MFYVAVTLGCLWAGKGHNSYQWNTGDTTESILINEGGIYSVTVGSINGCGNADSINVLQLEQPTNTVTLLNDSTLLSDQPTGMYQWLDCETSLSEIEGEVFQQLSVSQSGTYAVVVNLNGCIDTSACIIIMPSSAKDVIYSVEEISLRPNPTTNSLIAFTHKDVLNGINYEIFSSSGELVLHGIFDSTHIIDVSCLIPGVYLVRIGEFLHKIIVILVWNSQTVLQIRLTPLTGLPE